MTAPVSPILPTEHTRRNVVFIFRCLFWCNDTHALWRHKEKIFQAFFSALSLASYKIHYSSVSAFVFLFFFHNENQEEVKKQKKGQHPLVKD